MNSKEVKGMNGRQAQIEADMINAAYARSVEKHEQARQLIILGAAVWIAIVMVAALVLNTIA